MPDPAPRRRPANRGEPSRGEPSRGEPSRGEPSRGESGRGEASRGEAARNPSARGQAARGERRADTGRTFEQLAGSDGLFSRLTDRIIENPAQSGGLLLIGVVLVAIVSNAAFFQRVHHPDPFFITRPDQATVPLPKSRAAAVAPAMPSTATLVTDTQKALVAARLYDGPADGMLGAQTKASISAFEKKLGLVPTGQPSQRLLVQIRKGVPTPHVDASEPASTASIADPATRSRVKRIQEALNKLGYGPVDTDGQNGGKTATAVRRFQLDNGLPMSGVADSTVMAKLVMIGAVPAP